MNSGPPYTKNPSKIVIKDEWQVVVRLVDEVKRWCEVDQL